MDIKDILVDFGVEVPDTIENPQEFKQLAVTKIQESVRDGLLNSEEFYKAIPVERLPKDIFNVKYNEARAAQVAKAIKAVEEIYGIKAEDLGEEAKKDIDKLVKAAHKKYIDASEDEKLKSYKTLQEKAADLEARLISEQEGRKAWLEEQISLKTPELKAQFIAEQKQEQFKLQSEYDVLLEVEKTKPLIPNLDKKAVNELAFNQIKAQYNLFYNEDGTIEVRQKNNPELKAIKKGTVSQPITIEDLLIEKIQKIGAFSTEPVKNTNKEILTIEVEPNGSSLITQEFIDKQSKFDSRIR